MYREIKRFSPERLMKIRRLRQARRLFTKYPLFAYTQMLESYPDYSYSEFMDDLRLRRKKKKRKGKNPMQRFGRYHRIEALKREFEQTGNHSLIEKAMQLQRHLTRPYRVLVRIGKQRLEYSLSALVPITRVEQLVVEFATCKTIEQAEDLFQNFTVGIPTN